MVGNYKMENILSADELNKQGLDADKAGDKAKAFELYRKAAAMGHASAQYNLGLCYGNGEGVKQDYKKAAKWYRKAAEQGDPSAQFNLSTCYENGEGVQENMIKAAYWLNKWEEQRNNP